MVYELQVTAGAFQKRLQLVLVSPAWRKGLRYLWHCVVVSPSEIPVRDVHTLSQRFSLSLQGAQVATSMSVARTPKTELHKSILKFSPVIPMRETLCFVDKQIFLRKEARELIKKTSKWQKRQELTVLVPTNSNVLIKVGRLQKRWEDYCGNNNVTRSQIKWKHHSTFIDSFY